MDLGLITLRDFEGVPRLEAGHPAVVEWRAITVITLLVLFVIYLTLVT